MEREVIADIARRVKKTGRFTETAELMAKSMHEQGFSPAKIQAEVMKMLRADKKLQMEIAENTKAYKKEIKDLIAELVAEAKTSGNALIAEAGTMAWNDDMQMWGEHGVDLKKPNTLSQLIAAFQIQTVNQLRNLTRTTGFKGTLMGTTGVLNMYQKEMDLALLKVASGTFSYDQAINDCVHRLAQSGLRTIDYENGRTYQLDTAARMSVRTGMSQLAGRVTEMNLKATGQDLVITSQHMGSRPEHAVWQNKVFSYSGKSKKYPSLEKGTGYGQPDGLKGVNCMHSFYPFWEGASVIPKDIKEPAPVTVNGREYTYFEATQKQRKMERDIRATKREIEAQTAIGGDTEELHAKLRRQNAEYRKFSDDVGLKPKANRLKVASGTSDLKKTKAWKDMDAARRYENAHVGNKGDFKEQSLRTKGGGTYGVNWGIVKTKDYTERFEALSGNEKANMLAAKRSRNALANRSGKNTEEIYAISLTSGKDISSIVDQHIPFGVKKTDKFIKDVARAEGKGEKVLLIHNHPRGLTPSIEDLNELLTHNNAVGITVGHDGSIYFYSKPSREMRDSDFAIAFRKNKMYNGIRQYEKAMEELAKQFDFEFRIL